MAAVKRLALAKPLPCRECAVREMHGRSGEAYARAERQRRPDESLTDALRRVCVEDAVADLGDDVPALAAMLTMTPQGVAKIIRKMREERVDAAIARDRRVS